MMWSMVQIIGRQGVIFLTFAVLSLLLGPSEFGILGMAMAWILFIQAFSEMGFSAALIQKQGVSSGHFSTTFFVNVAAGILLSIAGILLSWPCSMFFKTPEVQPVMAVLSVNFIIVSFSLTQMAIAQKELMFRSLAVRDIAAAVIGGLAGISAAYWGFGVWSLVIQMLSTNLIGLVLLWKISAWRPRLSEFSFSLVKEIWPYSSNIFAFNIFKYFAQNADKLIIGYLLGSVALGLYTFAYKLVVYPVSIFAGAVGNYLFPKYSKMQGDIESVKSSYLFVCKSINSVVSPLMLMTMLLAPVIIPFVFGQKWSESIPLIQILTVVAFAQSLISPVGQLMKALNRPRMLFVWSVFFTFVVAVALWISTMKYGIIGSSSGLAIAHVIGVSINLAIVARLLYTDAWKVIESLVSSTAAVFTMGVFLFFLQIRFHLSGPGVVLPIGISVYIGSMILFDREFVVFIFRRLLRYDRSR